MLVAAQTLVSRIVIGVKNADTTPPAEKNAHQNGSLDLAIAPRDQSLGGGYFSSSPLPRSGARGERQLTHQNKHDHRDHQPGEVVRPGDQGRTDLLLAVP